MQQSTQRLLAAASVAHELLAMAGLHPDPIVAKATATAEAEVSEA
ncbi:hypothetical protein [Micromonospora zamorensis]|nr:hypothetical protein [Micromonospora zamorensis]